MTFRIIFSFYFSFVDRFYGSTLRTIRIKVFFTRSMLMQVLGIGNTRICQSSRIRVFGFWNSKSEICWKFLESGFFVNPNLGFIFSNWFFIKLLLSSCCRERSTRVITLVEVIRYSYFNVEKTTRNCILRFKKTEICTVNSPPIKKKKICYFQRVRHFPSTDSWSAKRNFKWPREIITIL